MRKATSVSISLALLFAGWVRGRSGSGGSGSQGLSGSYDLLAVSSVHCRVENSHRCKSVCQRGW